MRPLTIEGVEEVALELARYHMEWSEPIPDFSTRTPGILESCLLNSFQTFGGKELYPTLFDKAGAIFYQMIKNHPFVNGNKRIAVTSLLVFLHINGYWLRVDNEELYEIAVWVAKSPSTASRGMMVALAEMIQKHCVEK
ncbi:MAG: type II toxin-antitoxin system death-on-curing family toxin [Actinobacteria bacterium]|nr:MAG: type II toxin-antitoxin system death-on-curing family toxin [Actinomycetota bacterium]